MKAKISLRFSISRELHMSFTYELFFILSGLRKLSTNSDKQMEQKPMPLHMGLNVVIS